MAEEMILRDRNHPSIFMWWVERSKINFIWSIAGRWLTSHRLIVLRPANISSMVWYGSLNYPSFHRQVVERARSLNVQGIPVTAVYGPSQSYNDYTVYGSFRESIDNWSSGWSIRCHLCQSILWMVHWHWKTGTDWAQSLQCQKYFPFSLFTNQRFFNNYLSGFHNVEAAFRKGNAYHRIRCRIDPRPSQGTVPYSYRTLHLPVRIPHSSSQKSIRLIYIIVHGRHLIDWEKRKW